MSAIFPKQGRQLVINMLLRNGTNAKARLFKNNFAPDADTVFADFVEADFDGYAAVNLTGADATINGTDQGETENDGITFTRASTGAAQTVYGWYVEVLDPSAHSRVFLCDLFSTPQVVTNAGDAVVFNLRVFDQPAP